MTTHRQSRRGFLRTLGLGATAAFVPSVLHSAAKPGAAATARKPNIVLILADDLGWGDVSCNNAKSAFQTPQIDRLAREGRRFTNAHAPHSVCTPTRYALLTGRYCWRTFVREGVLPGYAKPLIPTTRLTLASLLKRHGYATGAFGKWHVGMGWTPVEGDPGDWHYGTQIHGSRTALPAISRRVNHNVPVQGGPTDIGFDRFFGTPSNCTRIPVFMRNDRVVGKPARDKTGLMRDPALRRDKVDDLYVDKATAFMTSCSKQGKPFFVYLPLNAAHGAVLPPKELVGKSGLSKRGDKCLWVDRSVGRIRDCLRRIGQIDNTLLIFTADNGPLFVSQELKAGHDASGPYRGFKTDVWEGGTRVPFVVRWPGKVQPGTTDDSLLCLTDMIATFAALVGEPLPRWAGEDSVNQLPALLGKAPKPLRDRMVTQSYTGVLAIRRGQWKLILDTKGSGGFYKYSDAVELLQIMAPWRHDMSTVGQLYDLEKDPYETTDLFEKHPKVVKELATLLKAIVNSGRSRAL